MRTDGDCASLRLQRRLDQHAILAPGAAAYATCPRCVDDRDAQGGFTGAQGPVHGLTDDPGGPLNEHVGLPPVDPIWHTTGRVSNSMSASSS